MPTYSLAQATGGVFGPVVTEGHRSIQYRSSYNPDAYGFAQRLQYQQSIDSTFMWRIFAQARKTADADVDYDFVQGELFWDLTRHDSQPWQTGVRFDIRVPDRGRPVFVGVNWMNQFELLPEWKARVLILTAIELGSDARHGILVQSRANVYRTLPNRYQYGLELFSVYGGTSDIASFEDHQHALGPFVSVPLSTRWTIFADVLFAVDGDAPDSNIRLWIERNF